MGGQRKKGSLPPAGRTPATVVVGLRKQHRFRKEVMMMPTERMAHSRKISMGQGCLEGFFLYKTLGF